MEPTLNFFPEKQIELIEARLQELFSSAGRPYEELYSAARYSLFSSGKRIRPLLVLATVEALGGSPELALSPACAIEMVHTYSLIHDDLPCMDNDDFRRGKPTLHKVYPEWHALLTGDFLLTYAFEVLAKCPGLIAQQQVQLVSVLASRAGGNGMVGGQFLDLAFDGRTQTIEELQRLHQLKTGALLVACLEFGGIVANATEKDMQILRQFGQNVGLAFQIVDDILDVTASEAKHGKSVGSDQINAKTTYATLLGIEECRNAAHRLYQESLGLLFELKGNTGPLRELARLIVQRES